ncbi:MAG: hypothetical protein COA82_09790 [Alkaliphilus sp.]|nr:MAG: hypothetical protein COA82_09790 [Alkaliphilus sp.]
MLLYLTSNKNIEIFDFLTHEHGIVIKKLSGSFKLKQFIIEDMRSLEHYSYFAIDISALKDDVGEIIEAIKAFKRMHSSRLIIYIENIKENIELTDKLIELGVYNIISSDTVAELKKEIQKATSGEGISKREIQNKLNELTGIKNYQITEYLFSEKNIKIAIAGAAHKAGTTTTAINLCNYLASIGARVCYVEANEHGHIKKLANEYKEMIVNDDSVTYRGVKYLSLTSKTDKEYNFIVYDTGVIEEKTVNAIKANCNEVILCATTKPYEIEFYHRALDLIGSSKSHTLFSFTSEKIKEKLKKQYKDPLFAEYSPNLFDGEKNQNIWEKILAKHMIKNTM